MFEEIARIKDIRIDSQVIYQYLGCINELCKKIKEK